MSNKDNRFVTCILLTWKNIFDNKKLFLFCYKCSFHIVLFSFRPQRCDIKLVRLVYVPISTTGIIFALKLSLDIIVGISSHNVSFFYKSAPLKIINNNNSFRILSEDQSAQSTYRFITSLSGLVKM